MRTRAAQTLSIFFGCFCHELRELWEAIIGWLSVLHSPTVRT
jgi:hypothetical protein